MTETLAADHRVAPTFILIVEDSRFDAELLIESLQRAMPGVDTAVVSDETRFADYVRSRHIDVILSDYELPGFSGAQALRIARELAPQTPFIFVSGRIGEDNAVELLKQGAVDFVSKGSLSRLPLVLTRALKEVAERRARGVAQQQLLDANRAFTEVQSYRATLVELGDRIRELEDPADIAYAAARLIGEKLQVDRVGYGIVDKAAETITIDRDWTAPGVASLAGKLNFRDYGSYIDDLREGRAVVFANAHEDARTRDHADALDAINARAVVNLPMTEDHAFVGLLYLNHGQQRPWIDEELAFIRDAGLRMRSEIARRESQLQLRALADSLEKQVEERAAELQQAKEQLHQSQKLESVGQLTGGIAHDFNNLLAAMIGSLEMIRRRSAEGRTADIERHITVALGAAKRASGLTHRLLAFARRQTLAPRSLNVNRLVRDMEGLIRGTIGPEIALETVTAVELWNVLVDPSQLESALLNLCINARDAMPEGGRLIIETANRWIDARTAALRDLPPGQYVSLSVSDNGTGMSTQVAERAFDPFFTTKPIGMGTGLGLSMVYGFTKQSGGMVRIYSEVGKGTTVSLYLPRQPGQELPADDTPTPISARAQHGDTVLVVDDEPALRTLMVEVMRDLGYATLEAGNGSEAMGLLRAAGRIDLLVTDVGLPGGMNGRQIADAARVQRPSLKALFITGYAENAVLSHGHLAPGMQILTKPFDLDVFANRVKSMIESPT